MTTEERIGALAGLGKAIRISSESKEMNSFWASINTAHLENPWFTPDFCSNAALSIAQNWLSQDILTQWVSGYPKNYFSPCTPKTIGVVTAGNIPYAGVHDLICVLISGHRFLGKLSSKDGGLTKAFVELLTDVDPRFTSLVALTDEPLKNFDAIIATGSDNAARHFDYYFGKYPNIVRHNRHSIAVLAGNESENELKLLSNDIFMYFGLGCRSVSKLLIPEDFDLSRFIQSLDSYKHLLNHHKYANNYEYHRAIFAMNGTPHLDNGFVLLKPDGGIGSPVGVIYFQQYRDIQQVHDYINQNAESLQCVVSHIQSLPQRVDIGKSQYPQISEYMDNIDTLEFLSSL
ncbi:MAG TPA: acyl-CoA reductase [Tenuifilaceae bacterium]|nr:acyl-CoA reductase [Tenuifilaceae bacterium]